MWKEGSRPGACREVSRRRVAATVAALALAVGAGACGGSPADDAGARPAAAVTNPVDPATAGRITGRVAFVGTVPAQPTIKTASDPRCTAPVIGEEIVPGAGGDTLQNVFVYVKDGLGNLVFPVPSTPAVLSQEGCTYRPHVLGIQVGQTLDIVNGDDTLHNIHAIPEHNGEFNKAQQFKGFKNTHVFSTKEVMVPFKCDVHKWMTAYVGVVDHPFFDVTGGDGTFTLAGLPPGTYTIEAVHEKLGRQTMNVTLSEKGTEDISFTFNAPPAGA